MGPVVPATRPSNRRKQLNLSILVKGVDLRRAKAALAWMLRGSQLRPHSEPMAVPSARPIPFLRAVSFALLALALALGGVLLWSAQAQAQTATVLISNTAQTSRSLGVDLVANYPKYAQAFTTGTNVVGYTTDSVGVRFHTIGDTTTAGDQLTVTLNAGQQWSSRRCSLHAHRPPRPSPAPESKPSMHPQRTHAQHLRRAPATS